MEIDRKKLYAVLTGDIVGSSRLGEASRQRLHRVMLQGSKYLQEAFPREMPLQLAIFRGDGWQMLITCPERSLRIGLAFRAHIRVEMKSKQIDTRLAIAIGAINFVPGADVSGGDGEAFRL